jgi:hypothetical protein
MRTSLTIAAVTTAAVAGVVAAGLVSAGADTPSGHNHHHAVRHLNVVERAVSDTTTDTGASGDSVGDLLTFANPVYDARNVRRVGMDNGSCIRTVVGAAYECSWTLTLRGGSLVVEGPFYDSRDSVLAITGGTGRFATARGDMTLHARNAAGTAYDFRYRIVG